MLKRHLHLESVKRDSSECGEVNCGCRLEMQHCAAQPRVHLPHGGSKTREIGASTWPACWVEYPPSHPPLVPLAIHQQPEIERQIERAAVTKAYCVVKAGHVVRVGHQHAEVEDRIKTWSRAAGAAAESAGVCSRASRSQDRQVGVERHCVRCYPITSNDTCVRRFRIVRSQVWGASAEVSVGCSSITCDGGVGELELDTPERPTSISRDVDRPREKQYRPPEAGQLPL